MTNAEESALMHWLTELTEQGFPARHSTLHDMTEVIRQEWISQINNNSVILVEYPLISKNWSSHFLAYHPNLKTSMAHSIEVSCIKEVTRESINRWFDTFASMLEKYEIQMEDVQYNMDETGF